MWEAIKSIANSPNLNLILTVVMIILFITLAIAIAAIKMGVVSVHTNHVNIGGDERERNIIQKQKEYAHAACTSMLNTILKMDDNLDTWRTKCVLEYVYDEIIDWITFNHITATDDYVNVKASCLRVIVRSNVDKDMFFTDEFNSVIDTFTKNMITELIRIRKIYK